MSSHIESILIEAEESAKSRTTRSFSGYYDFTVESVVYAVRDAGSAMRWTRDEKRISRKKVAEQLAELLAE